MNLNEMITFVRAHADADTEDATTANLTVYARAAYNDIRRRINQWESEQTSTQLLTTGGTAGYALSGLNTSLVSVSEVVGPSEIVDYVSWEDYLELEDGPDVDYSTREASFYTVRNGTIYLWPTPSTSAVSYTLYGYTDQTSWPNGGGNEPDLPRFFDEPICWYMLSKFYMAQEDIELAQMYMADYDRAVNGFVGSVMRASPRSRKLGGRVRGRTSLTYDDWVRRMTEG